MHYIANLKPFFMAGKNQLLRLMILDAQLRKEQPQMMNQLIKACMSHENYIRYVDSYDLEQISDRTIRGDLKFMRDEFGAPLPKRNDNGYQYSDMSFSIFQSPLMQSEVEILNHVGSFLSQFSGLGFSDELKKIVALGDSLKLTDQSAFPVTIDLGFHQNQKGNEWLKKLHQAILQRQTVHINYQPFVGIGEYSENFEPYLLKRYNSRWFILGKWNLRKGVTNYALDRILAIADGKKSFAIPNDLQQNHFNEIVGVTLFEDQKPLNIVLKLKKSFAYYVNSKPIHFSQQLVNEDEFSMTFSLRLRFNHELKSILLSYGSNILQLQPEELKEKLVEEAHCLLDQLKP